MQVVFYKARYGNWMDKLIAWKTSSWADRLSGEWLNSYSHVELVFRDAMMFSSSQYEGGTRYKKYYGGEQWTEISIQLNVYAEGHIRIFCDSMSRKKYDWLGVLGFVMPIKEDRDKWFCSELCTTALQIWAPLGLCPSKTSPNELYKTLVKVAR